jgi:hypothetical protein
LDLGLREADRNRAGRRGGCEIAVEIIVKPGAESLKYSEQVIRRQKTNPDLDKFAQT